MEPTNQNKNPVLQFLQDDNGNFSSTRLAFLSWIFVVIIAWGGTTARQGQLQNIPDSVLALVGVLMTGKVTQKFAENQSQKQPPAPASKSVPATAPGSTSPSA